jgi:hypothetical protein
MYDWKEYLGKLSGAQRASDQTSGGCAYGFLFVIDISN